MWKGGFRKRRAVGSNPIAWLPLVFDTNSYVRNGHERDRVISFCLSSLRLWRLVPRGAGLPMAVVYGRKLVKGGR